MQHSNKPLIDFTRQDVKVMSKKTLFSGFFKMIKYQFSHRLFDGGWSEPIEREMFERGHAVAVLPYDPITDQVVIIEQIRVGALEHQSPWQLEIVAGIIDPGETAEDVARREMVEEAGIEINQIEKITSFYPSSGGCSEKLDVYIGEVDASKASGTHGLDYEGEDIRVHVMSREVAYQRVKSGQFENGASIIALQWLELNHREVVSKWRL
ncbi:ADP-ribose diphosphatase [Vibrio lamellibrachiae]|uniref:ADP-ribose diphosphatase n=1 Tax=Vibrio lamellibrachiae TaxID=2910253 RepID=UPI003D0B9AC5